jgi:hypothetical protein
VKGKEYMVGFFDNLHKKVDFKISGVYTKNIYDLGR